MKNLIYQIVCCPPVFKWWLCFLVIYSYSDTVETVYSCKGGNDVLTFCESPCVVQVGLSVVRVTFNKFLVHQECVKKAAIIYWTVNGTKDAENQLVLDNFEQIYPKDCTYHTNDLTFSMMQRHFHLSKEMPTVGTKDFKYEQKVQNDNRYVYLYGLSIGGTYSIKINLTLNQSIEGRSSFSSLPANITLSTDEPFKSDGLVGHVNQGRCCDIKNLTYVIKQGTGECMLQTTFLKRQTSVSTYIISSLSVILISVVVILILFKLYKTINARRCNGVLRCQEQEVSFKYVDPEELYHDLSYSLELCPLNQKLLRSPTVAIRLPPEGEELQFEELKTKLKRQSI